MSAAPRGRAGGSAPARATARGRGGRRAILALIAALVATGPGIAGGAQQATPPRPVHTVPPVVPESLRSLRLSGWVLVLMRVDSSGMVTSVRGAGRGEAQYFFGSHARGFEEAALAAARTYRFEPGEGEATAAGTWATRIPFEPPVEAAAAPPGAIAGVIRDATRGQRLPWVGVCVATLRRATLSDPAGEYWLELPSGSHTLVFSAAGFAPVRRAVHVRAGAADTLDLALRPCASCARERCFSIPARPPR